MSSTRAAALISAPASPVPNSSTATTYDNSNVVMEELRIVAPWLPRTLTSAQVLTVAFVLILYSTFRTMAMTLMVDDHHFKSASSAVIQQQDVFTSLGTSTLDLVGPFASTSVLVSWSLFGLGMLLRGAEQVVAVASFKHK